MSSIARQPPQSGVDGVDLPPDAATLGRILAERYSCRAFRPDPVPRPVIQRLLDIAQLSPSWANCQPWQTIVTEGAGTERVREILHARAVRDFQGEGDLEPKPDFPFPVAFTGIYRERKREVAWQLYESVGIAKGDRKASAEFTISNFRLFNAPHMLLVTTERDLGVYGAIDCGLYLSSLMLAAHTLSLGMIPQAALAAYAPELRACFNIPEERAIVLGCSFGYPDEDSPSNAFRSRRAPADDATIWVTE